MSETVDDFSRAVEGFATAVRSVDASQWNAATPCTEWDVRALMNHVVNEMLWVAPLVAGKTVEDVGDQFDGDVLGTDPAKSWSDAAASALEAFGDAGAMERTVHLSFGDYSGNDYCWQLIGDLFVHTWDLARAVGADDTMPADLATSVHEFLAPMLAAFGPNPYFASAIAVADDATAQDKLLALTGRKA